MTDIPGSALETKKANEKINSTSGDWVSSINIGDMWREHPVATGVTTAAVAAATAYAAYRFGPAAIKALPEMGTAMKYGTAAAAAGVGLYGGGKLLFGDGANTFSGNSWTEHGANLLRSGSDVAVVGGATALGIAAFTRNPGLAMKGLGAIAAGASTHVGLDYLAPQQELHRATSVAFGHTEDWSADVAARSAGKQKGGYNARDLERSVAAFGHTEDWSADVAARSAGKQKGGYNASDLERKQKMPAVMVCDEFGCYDAQAIAGGKVGLGQFSDGKKSFAVYRLADESNENFLSGAGKLRDWKSTGAEPVDAVSMLAEKNRKLDIVRMLMDDQNKHRRYIQDIG